MEDKTTHVSAAKWFKEFKKEHDFKMPLLTEELLIIILEKYAAQSAPKQSNLHQTGCDEHRWGTVYYSDTTGKEQDGIVCIGCGMLKMEEETNIKTVEEYTSQSQQQEEVERLGISNEGMADTLFLFYKGEESFADSHKANWTLDFVKKRAKETLEKYYYEDFKPNQVEQLENKPVEEDIAWAKKSITEYEKSKIEITSAKIKDRTLKVELEVGEDKVIDEVKEYIDDLDKYFDKFIWPLKNQPVEDKKPLEKSEIQKLAMSIAIDFADRFQKNYPNKHIFHLTSDLRKEIENALLKASQPLVEYKPQWTDELIVMYAEVHRFSTGRISLKQFKEIINQKDWDKPLRKTAQELIKEWEENGEDKIGKAIEWCEEMRLVYGKNNDYNAALNHFKTFLQSL